MIQYFFKDIIKYILIISFFTLNLYGTASPYYTKKFNDTKKSYLGAIMSNNKLKEIQYLKQIIKYGEKLNINTRKYQIELNRLDKTISVHKPIYTRFTLEKKYTIKSVKQTTNSIVINFTKNINKSFIKFSKYKKNQTYYHSFDIKGNFKDAKPTKLKFNGILKTRIIQKNNKTLQISFKNKIPIKTIYILNKKQIIIKLLEDKRITNKKNKRAKQKSIKEKVKILPTKQMLFRNKTIVIDAGHGGRDSGAVGKYKRYEKNIVLQISKNLKSELRRKGFTVYLTRDRDEYIKLSKRTHFANNKNAAFFISIHANAARKARQKKAHGVETYFLSPARSDRAKRVAAKENKGDMKSMGWSTKGSLLTILNQAKITASNKMAVDIQKNMLYTLRAKYGKNTIRDGGVREGPFWVLVGAQMPSVLIEVGYISHPTEGKRINTKSYQKLIAASIADGIGSYFRKNQ